MDVTLVTLVTPPRDIPPPTRAHVRVRHARPHTRARTRMGGDISLSRCYNVTEGREALCRSWFARNAHRYTPVTAVTPKRPHLGKLMPSDSQTTHSAPCAPQEALSRPPPLSVALQPLHAPSSPVFTASCVAALALLCVGLSILQLTTNHDQTDDPHA
jgi:hypothetical protein